MDYGLLPPEVNSARIYAGPGSGPLLGAGTAWASLAAALHHAAAGHQSVISGLTSGAWLGPASTSLVAAAAPYVAWLNSSAVHAESAAGQATFAAAAYEAVFAMTVPPPTIAANRALLASLTATNILGQNTALIAATEADYFEMWAQDAAAMYAYAGSSATAAQLAEFEEPADVANQLGTAQQAAAVAAAEENSAQGTAQNALASVNSGTPDTLQTLAAPTTLKSVDDYISEYTMIDDMVAMYSKYLGPFMPTATATAQATNAIVSVTTFMKGLAPAAASAAKAVEGGANALGSAAAGAGGNAAAAVAGLGRALPLGALSVPPSWVPVTAVTSPAVAALNGVGGAAPAAASGVHALPMTPFGPGGGGLGGRSLPAYGFKPVVMARPPAAG
ncbi:PPE family protein [Mycobacterium sp. 852002-10029_SCH5224772]|uniref:PPE family protein n=1 Tax=Mycobacterium sp. 852002-10029_SCH5224772 TaxID=1834083 RepID=UPI000801995D|nr:PPE family protein [Mycobacterium sp. 852002-10029_SCH5224772]OBE97176.1 hypothetical protein A5775_09550 [Mycobacterium sp. 852002-10029_SCH5224772]